MDKSIIKRIAKQLYLEPALVHAVVDVEANGDGFFTDWEGNERIKIQFEPHVFFRELKKRGRKVRKTKIGSYYYIYVDGFFVLKNKVDKQYKEYDAFNKAFRIDPEATMLSTSWGLGQVMGFNHRVAGFSTVGEMVTAFRKSEHAQLLGMMNFIKNTRLNNVRLITHLHNRDWPQFAKGYNGKYYKRYNYDVRLERAYQKHNNN